MGVLRFRGTGAELTRCRGQSRAAVLVRRPRAAHEGRDRCAQLTLRSVASQCFLRSSRLRTLPAPEMGSASAKATLRGSPRLTSWPRQNSRNSLPVECWPGCRTTTACTRSPRPGSGNPDDSAGGPGRAPGPGVLDFGGIHVLAAGDDHVFEPADDEQLAAVVEVAGIARRGHPGPAGLPVLVAW
jgi:hypothetical protein